MKLYHVYLIDGVLDIIVGINNNKPYMYSGMKDVYRRGTSGIPVIINGRHIHLEEQYELLDYLEAESLLARIENNKFYQAHYLPRKPMATTTRPNIPDHIKVGNAYKCGGRADIIQKLDTDYSAPIKGLLGRYRLDQVSSEIITNHTPKTDFVDTGDKVDTLRTIEKELLQEKLPMTMNIEPGDLITIKSHADGPFSGWVDEMNYLAGTTIEVTGITKKGIWVTRRLKGTKEKWVLCEDCIANVMRKAPEPETVAEVDAEIAEETKQQRQAMEDLGKQVKITPVVLEDTKMDLAIDKRTTLETQFNQVIGRISDMTTNVNKHNMLKDAEELKEAFEETKKKLELQATEEPGKLKGYLDSLLGDNKYYKKIVDKAKEVQAENASTQSEIDYLFGLTHTKFDKLVTTGEAMQTYKAQLEAQIKELLRILDNSQTALSKYEHDERPIRMVATNTAIITALEKYKTRLLQISGSIVIAQNTIEDLGSKLPASKADLTDDMALNTMIASIDGLHTMCQSIGELTATVAEVTQKKLFTTMDTLMKAQINDTSATEAIESAALHGKAMATMIVDNTQKMSKKVLAEAAHIERIAGGVLIEHAQQSIKKLQ